MTSLFVYFFALLLNIFNYAGHPSHYTVTNIDYTESNKILAISIKVNIDDLAFVLAHNYDLLIDLKNDSLKSYTDSVISNYLISKLTFKINNKYKIPLKFEQKEALDNELIIYGKVFSDIKIKELEIMNALFFDTIMENTNLMIISKNGKEEGFKTTFYERVVK